MSVAACVGGQASPVLVTVEPSIPRVISLSEKAYFLLRKHVAHSST
ncbi:MAG: hypothetical protein ACRDQ1_19590 [Sciscionella sp.]